MLNTKQASKALMQTTSRLAAIALFMVVQQLLGHKMTLWSLPCQ